MLISVDLSATKYIDVFGLPPNVYFVKGEKGNGRKDRVEEQSMKKTLSQKMYDALGRFQVGQ